MTNAKGIIFAWSALVLIVNAVICWAFQLGPYAVR